MKRLIVFISIFTYAACYGMDNTSFDALPPSVTVVAVNAYFWFSITSNAIVSYASANGFRKKDPAACAHGCPIEIFVTKDIHDVNGIPIKKGSAFCKKPAADNCLWTSSEPDSTRPGFQFPTKYKIYYGMQGNQRCNCACSLVMIPNDETNKAYRVALCADGLHIEHKAPFTLDGLEQDYFKNFTYLSIRNCQKLQGTSGALNNILTVMKQLKYLDLTESQCDETIIDAEHEILETLILKQCNFTAVRRIVMPKLGLLILDHNPLSSILHSHIKVSEYCAQSFL